MSDESGDMKILGNFRRLIDLVTADALYNSSNPVLELENLEAKAETGGAAVEDISVQMAPNKVAINERKAAYDKAIALLRGSRNILKSSGASKALIADADTFAQKVLGVRLSKKKQDDPNTPENEAAQNHSASQLSFEAILGNFRNYVQMVKVEPLYVPNEAQFRAAVLEGEADNLEAKNNAVSTTFVPLSNARGRRDAELYAGENCVCDVAQMVKDYVKAVHGAKSPFYKTVNALSFKRRG